RHSIRKCPKRHRVFYDAGHAVEVGDIAERNDEVVIFEFELTRTEPGTDRYDPSIQIYVLDFPHDQVGAWTKTPYRRDDVGQADRAGNDFWEYWLVNPIIFAIDQSDASLLGVQELLQVPRGGNTREAAAEDEDPLSVLGHRLFEVEAGTIRRRKASG